MSDFGFAFICLVLSGLAIAGSLAMLPVVVALLYLAFWFKIS